MSNGQWFVLDLNPYPWKVPPFSAGRKGNALFVRAGRDDGLHTFKEAAREQIARQDPRMIEGPVELRMWFWRNVPVTIKANGRKSTGQHADTTNLQKATEDALQGLTFANDTDVEYVASHRVSQGPDVPGLVVVYVRPAPVRTWSETAPTELPAVVAQQVRDIIKRHFEGPTIPDADPNFYNPMG